MCYEKRDTEQARACFERDQRGEKMAEYIERDALLAEYGRVHVGPPGGARKLIEEAPVADVVPVVHGRWIHKGQRIHLGVNWWACSVCGDESGAQWMRYCPNCGARMDGE